MEEKKKNILKEWKFWIGVAVAIIIIIIALITLKKVKFEITDFAMTSNTTEYTTITNSTTYKGKGIITTQEKNGTYLVAIKVNLKSGGSEDSESYVATVLVNNGKGELSTYDSADEGKITKPEYEFQIIGYVKF